MLNKYNLTIILIFLLAIDSYSQFYFFGRNKIQYEKFDWKVLRTEHFDIYYYGEMEETASIGASYAEEAYDELKVSLNSVVTRRIPLIFYNTLIHFQQTNTTPGFIPEGVGGFFEFMKGRVVIPSTGSLKDFRHVIRHELVHVFMTNKIYKVLTDHRLTPDLSPPLWFTEGLAEYLSTEPDEQAEMVIRDAILHNYFFTIENIFAIYGTFSMYKEGQNYLEFVAERYGEEKIPQLIDNFWMYTSFTKVIEYTIGKSIRDIDKEWLYYLKQKYYPLMGSKLPQDIGAVKLTDQGFNFSPVYYKTDDSEYLYFVANRDGYSSLYRLDINSNDEDHDAEMVLRGEKTEELEAFHLFQSTISISDDGVIAFVTKSGITDAIHFYSIKDDKILSSYSNNDLINITSPKFSSDDKKVVFQAVDQKGFSDIYILDIETRNVTRVTNDYYDDQDPVFGVTDDQVIFSSDRTSGENEKIYNLFAYDIKNLKLSNITNINSDCAGPSLSEDKKTLMFTSEIDTIRNIWVIDINNGVFSDTLKKVSNFITSIYNPVFIEDAKIAFSGFERFSFNLYSQDVKNFTVYDKVKMNPYSASYSWKATNKMKKTQRENLKYEKEYTLDYAQSQISTDPLFGTRGGAIISFSDLLGDDNYNFLIYNTAEVQSDFLRSFNISLERVNLSSRTNYGYGIFHFSGRRYDIQDSDEYYFERSFGTYFALNFPLSKFDRIETQVSVVNSDKQVITGIVERKALLVSNTISYVIDNSLWGPTGPLDGIRGRLLFGFTGDVKFSNVNYFTVITDYRQYLRLGLRTSLAFRASMYYNEGKEARRYFMGGSWDLRGWPRWSIRGEKMWVSSLEFRYPLVDQILLQLPFINLGFFGIRGAVFADAGSAWDTDYEETLGSVGAGLRLNLFGVLVLRYDIGKRVENNLKTFQKGLFYQFFFGFDF